MNPDVERECKMCGEALWSHSLLEARECQARWGIALGGDVRAELSAETAVPRLPRCLECGLVKVGGNAHICGPSFGSVAGEDGLGLIHTSDDDAPTEYTESVGDVETDADVWRWKATWHTDHGDFEFTHGNLVTYEGITGQVIFSRDADSASPHHQESVDG